MSFDSNGYVLTPDGGPQLWFLDTRMPWPAARHAKGSSGVCAGCARF